MKATPQPGRLQVISAAASAVFRRATISPGPLRQIHKCCIRVIIQTFHVSKGIKKFGTGRGVGHVVDCGQLSAELGQTDRDAALVISCMRNE